MTFLLKDPDASLDYGVDWGAEYLNGDLLVGSSWSVTPDEPDGIQIAGSSFDPTIAMVTADGGIAGKIYRLVNHVTLASGLTDCRTITLRVEKR